MAWCYRRAMQRFIKNLLNPLVVLTMIAVVSAIAAFLPYAQVHWKTTYAAIVIIFVLGSAGVAYQMYGSLLSRQHREADQQTISRRPSTYPSGWRRPSGTIS